MKPKIFNSEMVRAILTCAKCGTITLEIICPKCGSTERLKTQTRRIAKLPEKWHRGKASFQNNPHGNEEFVIHGDCGTQTMYCPHGRVGDTLWVRETWKIRHSVSKYDSYYAAVFRADESDFYVADLLKNNGYDVMKFNWAKANKWSKKKGWQPSIYLPKWASRIHLEITNIRVERVQEITHADILREGIVVDPQRAYPDSIKNDFIDLWDSINANRGPWKDNPFVWVIEFKRKVSELQVRETIKGD